VTEAQGHTGAEDPTAGSVGLRLERDGPVATVTLCRPDVLNAQTPAMWSALREYGRRLPGDVRVVVVRGEGRAFSAGLDLAVAGGVSGQPAPVTDVDGATAPGGGGSRGTGSPLPGADPPSAAQASGDSLAELVALPTERAEQRIAAFQEAFGWLRRPDLFTLAAVQGHAIGAGFQLALACDARVLADDAKLCMAEVTLGLVPDLGGTKRLVELVGYARALELCVTGRRVGAAEAERIGLANLVVPAAELSGAVDDLTAAVLAAPRAAVIEIKALIAAAAGRTFPDQERAERAAQLRRLRDLAGLGE
jgi:enoyl-CoA hydratase/carnithine racemase